MVSWIMSMQRQRIDLTAGALILGLAVLTSACGIKGDLEPPPGGDADRPRGEITYPPGGEDKASEEDADSENSSR